MILKNKLFNFKLPEKNFLLFVVGVFVILVFVLTLIPVKRFGQRLRPVPTPAPKPAVELSLRTQLEKNTLESLSKTKIAKDSPYQGRNFEISYSQAEKAYDVSIKAKTIKDFRTIKKEAEKFFLDAGISNLCQIRIFFAIPVEIKRQINWEDLFATGCAPSRQ